MEQINFILASILDYIVLQFHTRTFWNWFFLFFPFVVFVEIPRYMLPVITLPMFKLLGVKENNPEAEENFLKTNPFVSIIVAGRNEAEIIGDTIESLLNLSYQNKEIIVVDDCSDDNMFEVCKTYADKGLIRLFRNNAETGRGGRPVATNLGLRMSRGQFIISVDADTSYDYDIIEKMIGPFWNPKTGAVAGNLKVRNIDSCVLADLQAVEYALSIGLWKRWTSILGTTLQASGAFGAFRKEAILDVGGWDPELAEDADISLKIKKCGWHIDFAPYAIAMTNVPDKLITLVKQRIRWDKGALRTYFHKHGNIMKFWQFPISNFLELTVEYLMIYIFPFLYCAYVIFMIFYNIQLLAFAYFITYWLYVFFAFTSMLASIISSERRAEEWGLLWYAPLFPFYKEIFRWVRLYANIYETFRWEYEESYIPKSGYKNSKKW
jgi:cellulose synthase/poly-beta-1,6-N-acetylglucosamine synthase-like glycosyltransferase